MLVLGGPEINLTGWVDSDWGACTDTRRSVSGYVFSLGSGLISWSSKKQVTVATSSTEAEYIASCHGVKEAVWIRNLLKLLDFEQTTSSRLYCDNVGSNILTATLLSMREQNTSTYNITMFENASKLGIFHTHIFPLATTSLTAVLNHSRTCNFKTLRLEWACAETFQLEGECWNTSGILVCKCGMSPLFYLLSLYYFRSIPKLYGHMWSQTSPSVV